MEFDFLSGGGIPGDDDDDDAIITNPPYGRGNRDAVRFAERALERCPGLVALLLQPLESLLHRVELQTAGIASDPNGKR